mmetsp:Transcript_1554/g.4153  ORF Transcript_1554/g.4153 Transcript_1554/m.4153 type:complete len:210 (-) Transcript_1554:500-1129(-)
MVDMEEDEHSCDGGSSADSTARMNPTQRRAASAGRLGAGSSDFHAETGALGEPDEHTSSAQALLLIKQTGSVGPEDLAGTTAHQARQMSKSERELVLIKRKLRNRESARKSRLRKEQLVAELAGEFARLSETAVAIRGECETLAMSTAALAEQYRGLSEVAAVIRRECEDVARRQTELESRARVQSEPRLYDARCGPSYQCEEAGRKGW